MWDRVVVEVLAGMLGRLPEARQWMILERHFVATELDNDLRFVNLQVIFKAGNSLSRKILLWLFVKAPGPAWAANM